MFDVLQKIFYSVFISSQLSLDWGRLCLGFQGRNVVVLSPVLAAGDEEGAGGEDGVVDDGDWSATSISSNVE